MVVNCSHYNYLVLLKKNILISPQRFANILRRVLLNGFRNEYFE